MQKIYPSSSSLARVKPRPQTASRLTSRTHLSRVADCKLTREKSGKITIADNSRAGAEAGKPRTRSAERCRGIARLKAAGTRATRAM